MSLGYVEEAISDLTLLLKENPNNKAVGYASYPTPSSHLVKESGDMNQSGVENMNE